MMTLTDQPTTAHLVHERFAAHAASAPDRVALEDGRHILTYGQVAHWAWNLAEQLRSAGVRCEDVIGLHLDRSAEAVVAMLGVLYSGAAFVSLPPTYPADRLRFMARDARVRLVVTGEDPVPTGLAGGVAVLSIGYPPAAPQGAAPPLPVVHPSNAAYVIYTSGSTGMPKGVVVSHDNVANLISTTQSYVRFSEQETVLQLSPLAFDPSALEIWGALAHGARLVVAAPSYAAIDELPTVLAEKRVTTLVLTPPLFHPLIEHRPGALDGVRQLIVGGDVLSAARSRVFLDRAPVPGGPPRLLINAYGPTEATTMVSAQPMDQVPGDAERVPIGPPISGARIHLLDEELRPVPVGGTGQIHLGGTPVARGYLNRPGLTAERFVPDPTAVAPGARMYATGDEGFLDESGRIVFVGRLDDQVKLRGHRIELNEIDHLLRGHPGVRDAAAVVVDRAGPSERLVCYIVLATPGPDGHSMPPPRAPEPEEAVRPDGTHDFFASLDVYGAAKLPQYMRPSGYVVCDELPLTRSGKVDRPALAASAPPLVMGSGGRNEQSSPLATTVGANDVEPALAEIWRTNLALEQVGLDEDFSALGGTSILAIGIVADAQERGLPLTLVMLFRNPTVRRAAKALVEAEAVGSHR
ncbi:non-ribosomal peptide synthetase [Streptomyces goshikiensis]|uniref:non-ribosomal peptide synthetase n=1 Tax=Streptomyces goshikiensis TaxID=1942 RepID=UPI003676ED26